MLEGKNINIRSLEEYDLKTFFQWSRQTEQNSFFLNDKNDVEIHSYAQLEKDYREKRSQVLIPSLPLVIEEINGNIIGFFRFTIYPGDNLNVLTGISFLQRDYFFNDLGRETGNLILDYFFNRKNLFRVYAKAIDEERNYLDYLLVLGFKLEGTQKDQIFFKGKYHNLCTLGMLREEAEFV